MAPLRYIIALVLISGGIFFILPSANAIGEEYTDTDGDGLPDYLDPYPHDPNKPIKQEDEDDNPDNIREAIEWLIDIKERVDDIWNFISDIPNKILNFITGIFDGINRIITTIQGFITNSINNSFARPLEQSENPERSGMGLLLATAVILMWFFLINILVRIWGWVNFIIPT